MIVVAIVRNAKVSENEPRVRKGESGLRMLIAIINAWLAASRQASSRNHFALKRATAVQFLSLS